MKLVKSSGLTAVPSGAASTPGDGGVPEKVGSDRAHGIRQVCRQLFGIPDYERYLAHAATHHPGAPVLSRRDFCAQAIERKYGKSGPRCC
jgi:uncharacterized short protein YbdD (DUF466 family)